MKQFFGVGGVGNGDGGRYKNRHQKYNSSMLVSTGLYHMIEQRTKPSLAEHQFSVPLKQNFKKMPNCCLSINFALKFSLIFTPVSRLSFCSLGEPRTWQLHQEEFTLLDFSVLSPDLVSERKRWVVTIFQSRCTGDEQKSIKWREGET